MTRRVDLAVNDAPVALDYFAQGFVDHVVTGILKSLEGTGPIKKMSLVIDGDAVIIELNGAAVPTNPFVSTIVKNTALGMVHSLKGVSAGKKVRISIDREP